MYAGDHDGEFPSSLPDGSPVTTANQAFRVLVPEYIQRETIFYAEGSAWTPKEPDNDIVGDKRLAPGENAFAYISNLTDRSSPNLPLIATGFLEGKPGVYGDDSALRGGISKGYGVAFVCVEGSGRLLKIKRKAPSSPAYESRPLEDERGASKERHLVREEGSPDLYRVAVEYEDRLGFLVKERGKDLFKPAPGWLAPNQVPLNPE